MEEYRDLFLAEANDYLQSLNRCLLEMEKTPKGEQLTEMFRAAHSLKGMAGTMGYDLISGLTHEMESLLDQLRSGEAAVDKDFTNLLFDAVDLVQLLVDNLESQDNFSAEVKALEKKLQDWGKQGQIHEHLPPVRDEQSAGDGGAGGKRIAWEDLINEFEKEMLKDAFSRGEKVYQIYICLRRGSLLKSVRAFMVLKNTEKQGEVIKTLPSIPDLEEETFDREFFLLLIGKPDIASLTQSLENISEVEKVEITKVQMNIEPKFEEATLQGDFPTDRANMQKRPTNMEEVASLKGASSPSVLENSNVVPEMDISQVIKRARTASNRTAEKTIRVETAKLDNLVNLVGELIINRTRVIELGKKIEDELLEDSLEQLERITAELQSAVMTLRMVPIKQVFDRFPRMVRDLSVEKQKEIELIISGEETELDRTLVNQVGDPLVHLLRNAIDHGLEDREERVKKGKDPVGKIYLEAHHEGSHVVVSVEDDGRGIDPAIIKDKALEKNIISPEEADKIGREEALRLIFRSGFSTSREVTDISGRGVGMDVVKASIEAINGTVEVKSEPGRGCKFVLRLPLTLAIIRTLMVESSKEVYAVPIEAVRENLYIEPQDIKTIQGGKVITLREEVLPLYSLKEILGMGKFEEQDIYPVVVVQAGDKKAGFIVDELLGQQEVVIKSLSKFVNDIKGIAGATVLGDGRVTLILDVAGLLEDGRF
ncbi:MAG TPA: chemotaxis protein CheA [Firmicutes bacterium]|jgi:two-component system chemotaxis sensor kinase CheA|nr:chemotaxis protein CheA [Bacillota bacterium]